MAYHYSQMYNIMNKYYTKENGYEVETKEKISYEQN